MTSVPFFVIDIVYIIESIHDKYGSRLLRQSLAGRRQARRTGFGRQPARQGKADDRRVGKLLKPTCANATKALFAED